MQLSKQNTPEELRQMTTPTELYTQVYLALAAKIAPGGFPPCSQKKTVHYMLGQKKAISVQKRGITKIQVIMPKISAEKSFTKYVLTAPGAHIEGSLLTDNMYFPPIKSREVRKHIITVVKLIQKLGIPIALTAKIPPTVKKTGQYTIWAANLPETYGLGEGGSTGGHTTRITKESFVETIISFHHKLADNPDTSQRAILHEFMHAFFIQHIPPIEQESVPHLGVREFFANPEQIAMFKKLVTENRCAIPPNVTVMTPVMDGGYIGSGQKFSISNVDAAALKAQFDKMKLPSTPRQDIVRASDELCLLSWSPPANQTSLATESPEKNLMIDYYSALSGNAFKAFGYAFFTSTIKYLIELSNLSKKNQGLFEKGVNFMATVIFYNQPAAMLSLGVGMVIDHAETSYPNTTCLIPYLTTLTPVILATLFSSYESEQDSALLLLVIMLFELFINMIFSVLGTVTAQRAIQGAQETYQLCFG